MMFVNLYADGSLGSAWDSRECADRVGRYQNRRVRVALIIVKPKVTA